MSVLFWVLLAVGLGVIEIISITFFPIFFAVSAAIAVFVQLAGGADWLQWLVFGAGGLVLSLALRPVAKRQLERGPTLRSGVEELVGRTAVVSAPIDGRNASGAVSVDGQVWSAKPAGDGLAQIPVGVDVEIQAVRGATLIVLPLISTEVHK